MLGVIVTGYIRVNSYITNSIHTCIKYYFNYVLYLDINMT